MSTWLATLSALAALTLPQHWLHNPRERAAAGVAAWRRHDFAGADRALGEALELGDGSDPRLLFNAGTGRLGAGTPGAALPLLSKAAAASGELRPDALYNLGNAYLAAGDAAAAAESYRSALRLLPEHRAAKHNLELALREQQRQQQQQQQEQQQQRDAQQQQRGGKPQTQPGGQGPGPQRQPTPDAGKGQPGAPAQGEGPQPPAPTGAASGQQQRSSRLPGFAPQRDMSADQAAALLAAIENLEREQRRAQAEEQRRLRARAATGKDW